MYTRIAALVIMLALFAGVGWKGYVQGKAHTQALWDADIAARTAAALEAERKAREAEQELQGKADAIRRSKNAEILALNVRVGEYARRLQNRPDRPAGGDLSATPGLGGSPANCTGAGLFKRDGEFLTGLAADADKLRVALGACQDAYRNARTVAR